ncbi:hypothetical protein QTP88_005029 [Uroleucon formosanum]
MKLSSTELEIKLKEIIKIYSDDLSPNILNELLHLRKIHKSVFLTEIEIPPLKFFMTKLLQKRIFNLLSSTELEIKLKEIIKIYSDDLSPNILNELLHLRKIHKSVFLTEIEIPPLKLLNEIYIKKLENIFINTCIALRIFCTLPVTVSEAERAFSKLGNQLKTWQRASIGQERLNALGILSIEHKLASSINFDDIIHNFAQKKARKEKFS